MKTKVTILVTAGVCLIVGGAAGYFGATQLRMLQRGQRSGMMGNFRSMPGAAVRQAMGVGRVIGSVQSLGDGRMTVQTPGNSSQIVLINGSTNYQKVASGTAGDVVTGTQVIVTGQQNPDGSTTASSIQVIPEGMSLPFGNRPAAQ